MKIVENKRQNNIAEYIIHMYQTEDLIRAFDCDMEQVKEYVIKHIPQNESEKSELIDWYTDILNKMKSEQIEKSGHLKATQNIVSQLEELKRKLIDTDEDFDKIYKEASPSLEEMKKLAEGAKISEVQICLNGIYGLLLAKINGKQVPDDIKPALEHFGNLLSYLSYKYKQQEFMSDN